MEAGPVAGRTVTTVFDLLLAQYGVGREPEDVPAEMRRREERMAKIRAARAAQGAVKKPRRRKAKEAA